MELNSSGPDDHIGIEHFFKDLYRCPTTRNSDTPAPARIVLDAADFLVNFVSYQFPGFLFGLLPVQAKGKYDCDVFGFCSSEIKLFEEGRQQFCSGGRAGNVAYNYRNL